MTIDKEQLKALAEAATKGARELLEPKTINPMGVSAIPVAIPSQMAILCHVFGSFSPLHDSYVGVSSYRNDADFIAAVTPDVILALIAEIERREENPNFRAVQSARQEAERLKAEIDRFDEGMRSIASSLGASGYNAEHLSAAELVDKVCWGVDHLCDTHERRITELKAENEALREDLALAKQAPLYSTRQDAKRYRWLIRRISKSQYHFLGAELTSNTEVGVDAAIDAAMAKEESHE